MEPLGLVKDEYVQNTITTSSIPLYQTKNLGLTQYTPNRYTSYLTNYNEDMRKIDRFSTSIGAYIEKTLDEADAEHQRLDERINNTNSVLAFTEKRVDNVEEALTELETDIAQVRVEIHDAVADSEERMTELISQNIAATSSTLAYLDKKINENDAKQTLAYSGLSQRMHVAEDELKTLKESSASYLEDITNLQTAATNLETRVTSLEELEQVNHEDIVNAQKKLMAHDTELASLANTETVQNQTIASLTEQVAALNTIGEDVNKLLAQPANIYLKNGTGTLNVTGITSTYITLANADDNTLLFSVLNLTMGNIYPPNFSLGIGAEGTNYSAMVYIRKMTIQISEPTEANVGYATLSAANNTEIRIGELVLLLKYNPTSNFRLTFEPSIWINKIVYIEPNKPTAVYNGPATISLNGGNTIEYASGKLPVYKPFWETE